MFSRPIASVSAFTRKVIPALNLKIHLVGFVHGLILGTQVLSCGGVGGIHADRLSEIRAVHEIAPDEIFPVESEFREFSPPIQVCPIASFAIANIFENPSEIVSRFSKTPWTSTIHRGR